MPSTATITAFYSFTGGTKARATQVNNNFDAFRGHIIPISPLTATASHNTYDLGSTEWRFRTGHVGSVNLLSNTTTGNDIVVKSDTATTYGGLVIEAGGTEIFRASKNSGMTTAAAKGQRAHSAVFSYSTSGSTAVTIAASVITLQSSGKTVKIEMVPANTSTGSYIGFNHNTSTATNVNGLIYLYVNSTIAAQWQYATDFINVTGSAFFDFKMSPYAACYVASTSGTNTFYIVAQGSSGEQSNFLVQNLALTAKEEF